MKQIRLQKVFTLLVASVLLTSSFSFLSILPAKATFPNDWSEITPINGAFAEFSAQSAMSNASLPYANNQSYDVSKNTSFTDLVETKTNGIKVTHFFMAVPWSNQSPWNPIGTGMVYHYASTDNPKIWVAINPSNWGQYGGSNHISLKAIEQSWTDAAGSIWNKKLFMLTNTGDPNNASDYVDYQWTPYSGWRSVLYRYDGNGTSGGANWKTMFKNFNYPPTGQSRYTFGTFYNSSRQKYHYGSKTYFEYIDVTNNGINDGSIYMVIPYVYDFWGGSNTRLHILKYTGIRNAITDDLIKTPVPPQTTWQAMEIPVVYNNKAYYNANLIIFDFVKAGNYLFLTTAATNDQTTNPYIGSGKFYRIDPANFPTVGTALLQPALPPPAPLGRGESALSYDAGYGKYYFTLRVGGTITGSGWSSNYTGGTLYRAYVRPYPAANNTKFYMNFGADYDYSTNMTAYWPMYVSPGYYSPSPRGMMKYAIKPGSLNAFGLNTMELDGVAAMPYWIYYRAGFGAGYNSTALDVSSAPTPLSLLWFKGYLYAGCKGDALGSKFYRTNNLNPSPTPSNVLDASTWESVGPITAVNGAGLPQVMRNPITALGKSMAKNMSGVLEDSTMFIGGGQGSDWNFTGPGIVYSTIADVTPVTYGILEDEWRYTKNVDPIGSPGSIYRGSLTEVYDMYSSSKGLVLSFSSQRQRLSPYGNRYFHLFNAPPTCDISLTPIPIVIERGYYADPTPKFTFKPVGGFGSGTVTVKLNLNDTIYLPKKDSNGNPIAENLKFGVSIPMNTNTIILQPMIKATNATQFKTYPMSVSITDDATGDMIVYNFNIQVIPPKPGFSVEVSPPTINLYQGDCPPNSCCTESCQVVNLGITSRNDFEDNAIIAMVWQPPFPSLTNDISVSWLQSSFIYDYISNQAAEVNTRKNITTQYQTQIKITSNTTVGTWYLKVYFISGKFKKTAVITINVLPPKPGIKITSTPPVIRVVPGAVASYRIKVESLNGFTGTACLSLLGIPAYVTATLESEILNPGYDRNCVLLNNDVMTGEPIPAYATLVIQTYTKTKAPSAPKSVTVAQVSESKTSISWTVSADGSFPVEGYEIWRDTSQYLDDTKPGNKLKTVKSGVTSIEDATIQSKKSYFYFVRAFDNQIPPNYSDFTSSGEVKTTSLRLLGTTSQTGTSSGTITIGIPAQGVGFDPGGNVVVALGTGSAILQVLEQTENMATPTFSWWTAFLLLLSMVAAFIFVMEKRIKKSY